VTSVPDPSWHRPGPASPPQPGRASPASEFPFRRSGLALPWVKTWCNEPKCALYWHSELGVGQGFGPVSGSSRDLPFHVLSNEDPSRLPTAEPSDPPRPPGSPELSHGAAGAEACGAGRECGLGRSSLPFLFKKLVFGDEEDLLLLRCLSTFWAPRAQ